MTLVCSIDREKTLCVPATTCQRLGRGSGLLPLPQTKKTFVLLRLQQNFSRPIEGQSYCTLDFNATAMQHVLAGNQESQEV
jgi:hypothetical protein